MSRCVLGCGRGAFAGVFAGTFWVRFRCVLGVCALPPYPYVPTPLRAGRCTYCGQGERTRANLTSVRWPKRSEAFATGASPNIYNVGGDFLRLSSPEDANYVAGPMDGRFHVRRPPGRAVWVSAHPVPRALFSQAGARGVSHGVNCPMAEASSAQKARKALASMVVRAAVEPVLQTWTQNPFRHRQNQPVELGAPGRFVRSAHSRQHGNAR